MSMDINACCSTYPSKLNVKLRLLGANSERRDGWSQAAVECEGFVKD